MNSKQSYCLGRRHYNKTNKISQYEKVNPGTKKLVKSMKGTCCIHGRNKSQIFTK